MKKVPNNEWWYVIKNQQPPRLQRLELLNKLEHDLKYCEPYELQLIIDSGLIPKEFSEIIKYEAGSSGRLKIFEKLKEKLEDPFYKEENAEAKFESELKTDEEINQKDEIDTTITEENNETEPSLPSLTIIQDLYNIDNYNYNADDERLEALIQFKLRKAWNTALNDNNFISLLLDKDGGERYNIIKQLFFDEYNEVVKYIPPKGYNFKIKNKIAPPLLMQSLTVYRLLKYKIYGNWSGTGTGKTLSYILASRSIDAKITLVVVLNSIVKQTVRVIKSVYPDSVIYTQYDKNLKINTSKNNYIILNYEKFQQNYSEELYQHLNINHKIDFIVIDEIHNIKHREDGRKPKDDPKESIRRQVLSRIIGRSKEKNPNLYLLALSATPIINDISEAKSLLELMTGYSYDDIGNSPTIDNGREMFKALSLNGLRYIPKYDITINELTGHNTPELNINGDHLADQLSNISSKKTLDIEKILIPDKLNAIKKFLKKGTVIYSYFKTDIINQVISYVEDLGFKIGTYTGDDDVDDRDKTFAKFKNGEIDILIGTKPIGTGLDELQECCNQMILLNLPWTHAEYVQLIGRLIRKGHLFKNIDIIIPQIKINLDNDVWSWDIQRFNRIKFKKTLSDLVIDGIIPSDKMPSIETMRRHAIQAFQNWKDRIASGNIIEINRRKLEIVLYPEILDKDQKRKQIDSDLQEIVRKAKTSKSSTTHKEFTNNSDSWFWYHALRNESMKSWNEIPYEYIAKKIKNKRHYVADFGCGENKLKDLIPNNKVISFDHVAFDNTVNACDMKDVSDFLKDKEIDVAVFSLALWGTNYKDYLIEAYRVLDYGGYIYIAEPSKKYDGEDGQEELKQLIVESGFKLVGDIETRGKFIYITGSKN